ncbi:hypothetical protein ACTFIW_011002 [Dictyostelium discoideum]
MILQLMILKKLKINLNNQLVYSRIVVELNHAYLIVRSHFQNNPDDEGNKKCTEIYFNNITTIGSELTVNILKSKNILCLGYKKAESLFDPDNSGQQVESIKVRINLFCSFVEARHLIKVNQFENLHSLSIPINSYQILSNLSEEMGFIRFYKNTKNDPPNSNNIKSELNQMILIIGIDCMSLLNINTFSNLLNNKSIKYLYLYGNSDFIVYSSKLKCGNGSGLHKEPISINQYLFDNIFTSPLTSIRHYKIKFNESKQLKLIFNLILNNIFKLQLYSLIFEFDDKQLVDEFVKEFKNFIINISMQKQQQKSNIIYLKEIKIKTGIKFEGEEFIQELFNFNNPYFTTVLKNTKNKQTKILLLI